MGLRAFGPKLSVVFTEIYDDNRVYLSDCLSWPVASKRLPDKDHTLIGAKNIG